ncbi:MerR family transcriptional regulator [Vallitalea pronyensis]|uniref:MerR family transcriptional regulator n=1 Tax=Vallitalea pronyensis TaxID=1348613 RepID=A0A8J8MPV4_9FIRM|nr:MerR family transcriptional regulator [Vallitalea pronyensis]QUI25178.1 MerR family transcriptional regulator [Vallitalea pronyensis]
MYIGEFSKKLGVSADTVRYYINIGLLLPQKRNHKYYFLEDNIDVMKEILRYKRLNFTLDEIGQLLHIKNAFFNINQANQKYVLDLLMDKQQVIKEEIHQLESCYNSLQEKIDKVKQVDVTEVNSIGIPVNFIHNLVCPHCGKSWDTIEKDKTPYIHHGALQCSCGYAMQIKDGIIITQPLEDVTEENHTNIIDNMQQHLGDYYQNQDSGYHKIMNQMQIVTNQCLLEHIKHKKVIVSMGISPYKILKNIVENLDQDAYYIILDHRYHYLKYIKQHIDVMEHRHHVIFIYGDREKLPLKHHIADLMIDLFYTDVLALHTHYRDLHLWKTYLHPQGTYYTYYCTIKPHTKTAWVNQWDLKKNYLLEHIRKEFRDHGFKENERTHVCSLPLQSIFYEGISDIEKELIHTINPTDSVHIYSDVYTLEASCPST